MAKKSGRARKNQQTVYPIQNKMKNTIDSINGLRTIDTFTNFMARTGFGMPNLAEGTAYVMTRTTQQYNLLNILYRNNWVCRRIVDMIPKAAMKNGFKLTCELTPDEVDDIDKVWRELLVNVRLLKGLDIGRLYGGGGLLMMIDGQEDMLDEPLDFDMIGDGDFCGLIACDRWSGLVPGPELVTNPRDPEFGMPKYYYFRDANSTGLNSVQQNPLEAVVKVHHSRVIRFIGDDLPQWELQAEQYWGASKLEAPFEEIKKRDNASANITGLMFMARLSILKVDDLLDMMASTNEDHKQQFYQMMQSMTWLRSNFGTQIMNSNDNYETHDYSFGGINDIYESFMLDVSGAAQIPIEILFGRSPTGLGANGQTSLINYANTISDDQESHLRPALNKLLPVVCMSTLGYIPDNLDFRFNRVFTPSDKEQGETVKWKSDAIAQWHDKGVISDQLALMELKDMSDDAGIFTNITEDLINKASDDPADNMPVTGGLGFEDDEDPEGKDDAKPE